MTAEAAVAILHARGEVESVLLMRRAERDGDPWSGHWSFPGGRRDPGDADLLDTALRELCEECGITLGREHLEAPLGMTLARRRTGPVLPVAPFVFRIDSEIDAVPDQYEAVEAVWVPVERLRDPRQHSLSPIPGLARNTLFPSIRLPEMPLWGFTYRLITEWLRLLPEDIVKAGQMAACDILDLLVAEGLSVIENWMDGAARVAGEIPVERVCARFTTAGPDIPAVNMVEVRSDCVRIAGLAFEEYVIRAER